MSGGRARRKPRDPKDQVRRGHRLRHHGAGFGRLADALPVQVRRPLARDGSRVHAGAGPALRLQHADCPDMRAMFVAYLAVICGRPDRVARPCAEARLMRRFLLHNSLSLFFGVLFLLSLAGQSFAGWHQFNALQVAEHLDPVSWGAYVTSSDFAVDVAENWQSESCSSGSTSWPRCGCCRRAHPSPRSWTRRAGRPTKTRRWAHPPSQDLPPGRRPAGWRTRLYSTSMAIVMGAIFLGFVACPVGRGLGGVQREAPEAAAGPDHVGPLPDERRLLGADVAELAERVPRRWHHGGAGDLPAPARVFAKQTRG